MYTLRIQTVVLFFLIYQIFVNACYLWGTDSGECVTDSLDLAWKTANIPFCAPRINFPICVPKYQVSLLPFSILLFPQFSFDGFRLYLPLENFHREDGLTIQS